MSVLAIGTFDGMHLAHQKLISMSDRVLVINTQKECLTPHNFREKYTNLPCYYMDLNQIRELHASEFLELIRSKFPDLRGIAIGYDFKFGKNREGDIKFLRENFDGEIKVLDKFSLKNRAVHSTYIKELLREGKCDEASEFLGHFYMIGGKVVRGQGLGKKSLVPTLNLEIKDFLLPKDGVYASFSYINGKKFRSVSFIGNRVSTDKNFAVESHILDEFICENYSECEIEFVKFIRENRKFSSLNSLKSQILDDINLARLVLENSKNRGKK